MMETSSVLMDVVLIVEQSNYQDPLVLEEEVVEWEGLLESGAQERVDQEEIWDRVDQVVVLEVGVIPGLQQDLQVLLFKNLLILQDPNKKLLLKDRWKKEAAA